MNNEFKLKNGSGCLYCKGCGRQDKQLNTYDWLADIPGNAEEQEMVEVQFKNTRKGYFKNSNKLKLDKGDIVAVEASPGHDIGVVTLTGRLVPLQMRKANLKPDVEIKRIYRKVKPVDMEKYEEAKAKEHDTMIRSRQIALNLNLNMKIGDVEYQGDGNKAIFYYIADERVDFRQLIKVLAETFRVRIEMKQIGARQEAGRIGGLGACGRELCCASWISSFSSVTTNTARMQELSLNPQKLAGQCSKLKCCLAYEYDTYADARRDFPRVKEPLQALDGEYYLVKSDILARTMQFSSSKDALVNVTTLSVERVKEIQALNRAGKKVDRLLAEQDVPAAAEEPTYRSEEDSITRFDGKRRNNKRRRGDRKGPTRDRAAEGAAGAEVAAGSEAGASDRGQRGARPVRNPQKGGGSVSGGGENGVSQGGERPRGERRSGRRGNGGRNGENRGGEGRNGDGRGERSRQGGRSNRGGSQGNANGPASGPSGENGGGKGDKE